MDGRDRCEELDDMIRILQVVNIMDRAGLETMLMNYYRHIDREKIQFDFLTHRSQSGAYDEKIRKMGGKVYHAPRLYPNQYSQYFRFMKKFFEEHPEYKIIHSHIDAMSYFPLRAAKENHIPIRIAHSHSSKLDRDLKLPIKYMALKNIEKVANVNCACGSVAGKFMFPNNDFHVVNNAIELNSFTFDEKIRNIKRRELKVENQFVIGHVGRYCYIKNQMFLLDVFKYVLAERENSHLLLIGKGEDQDKLKKKIRDLGIENKVSLLIDRADVAELYQAMDVFVLPSLFEGLPMVGVEAQANGLPCVVSDKISKEIMLTNNIMMLRIRDGAQRWSTEILDCNLARDESANAELSEAGYDVEMEASKLQQMYFELLKQFKVEG